VKIAVYDNNRVGVVDGARLVDISDLVPGWDPKAPSVFMPAFMTAYAALAPRIRERLSAGPAVSWETVTLRPPVPAPSKILAAPVNYRAHQAEMTVPGAVYEGWTLHTVAHYGVFLKPPSSLLGSGGTIEIPFADRRTDHEGEVGVVIGRQGKDIRPEDAWEYVFGYTGVMDITVRGEEDRTYRKGFDTFTPMGPWIVTTDEIPDPRDLRLTLTVNGQVRQHASLRELIYDIPQLIAVASTRTTLFPGDVISTGTPDGVGPIRPGDRVVLSVEGIGELTADVALAAGEAWPRPPVR
jgi:2-keto-4-pentenoate hydratase/2-oxohepta-3-ene-1,7-dioic acid hydratase in catechol pathway